MASNGSLIGGVIGAVIGVALAAYTGGTSLAAGAAYGYYAGSLLGGIIAPGDPVRNEGPRLDDLHIQTSTYGNPIFRLFGKQRFSGNIIWCPGILESSHNHDQTDTWGSTVATQKDYTYRTHLAIALCEGEIDNVTRIWADNKLIYDVRPDPDERGVDSQPFTRITKYFGTETQDSDAFMANWDPTTERDTLYKLVDLGFEPPPGYVNPFEFDGVPYGAAYRGLAYVVFKDFSLEDFGNRIPRFEFEVHRSGDAAYPPSERLNEDSGQFEETNWDIDPRTGDIWRYRTHASGSTIIITDGVSLEEVDSFELQYYYTNYNVIPPENRHSGIQDVSPIGLSIDPINNLVYIYNEPGNRAYGPYGDEEANVIWTLDLFTHEIVDISFEDWGIRPAFWISDYIEWVFRLYITAAKYNATTGSHVFFSGYFGGRSNVAYNLTGHVSKRRESEEGVPSFIFDSIISVSNVQLGGNVQFLARWLTSKGKVTTTPTGHPGLAMDNDWSGLAPETPRPMDHKSWMVVAGVEGISISEINYEDFSGYSLNKNEGKGGTTGYKEVYVNDFLERGIASFFYDPVRNKVIAFRSQEPTSSESTAILVIDLNNMEAAVNAPTSFIVDGGGYSEANDLYIFIESGGFTFPPTITYRYVDPDTWEIIKERTAGGFRYSPFAIEPKWAQSYFILGSSPAYAIFTEPGPGLGPFLSDVVEEVLTYPNAIDTADVDVTNLVTKGDRVRGYCITRQTSPRAILDPLRQHHRFDIIESDWLLKARHRGGASLTAVTEEDLGAAVEASGKKPRISFIRGSEIDLPIEVAVTYSDEERDYLGNTQRASKQTGNAENSLTVQLPLVLTADEAATTAIILLFQDHIARTTKEVSLPFNYLHIEPGDRIPIPRSDQAGEYHYMLVTEVSTDPSGVLILKGVRDIPETYDMTATGDPGENFTSAEVEWAFPVITSLLDIPLLTDDDDDRMVYAISYPLKGTYFGAQIDWFEPRNERWQGFASHSRDQIGIVGHVIGAALPEGPATIFDEDNIVSIVLKSDGHWLPNATRLEVLNGANMCLIGNELLQFKNSSYESDGTWTLSGFLRGRRGTEWTTPDHKSGERFVFFAPVSYTGGLLPDSTLQTIQYFRSIPPINNDEPILSTLNRYEGENLRPYSPVLLDAEIADASLALSWTRRSRRGGKWQKHDLTPLIESREQYLVQLIFSTGEDARLFATQPNITFDSVTPLKHILSYRRGFESTPIQGAFNYAVENWNDWDSGLYFDPPDFMKDKITGLDEPGPIGEGADRDSYYWRSTTFSNQRNRGVAQCMRTDGPDVFPSMWEFKPAQTVERHSSVFSDFTLHWTRGWSDPIYLNEYKPRAMVFFRSDTRKEHWKAHGVPFFILDAEKVPLAVDATIFYAFTAINWHEDVKLTVEFSLWSVNQYNINDPQGPNAMRLYARMFGENELDNDEAGIYGYFLGFNVDGSGWKIVKQLDWKKEGDKIVNQTILGEVTTTIDPSKIYHVEFEVTGATIRGKVYEIGAADPGWQISEVDSSILNGGWSGIATYDKEAFFAVYDFSVEATADISYPTGGLSPILVWTPTLINTDEELYITEINVFQLGTPRLEIDRHILDPYNITLADGLQSRGTSLYFDAIDWAESDSFQYSGKWGNTPGTLDWGVSVDEKKLTKIKAWANADIDWMEYYAGNFNRTSKIKGVIYSSASDGEPGSLLGTTDEVTGVLSTWNRLTFSSGEVPTLTDGADYWVGVIVGTTNTAITGLSGAFSGDELRYGADTYADGPSDPAGVMTAPPNNSQLAIKIHFLTDDPDNNKL